MGGGLGIQSVPSRLAPVIHLALARVFGPVNFRSHMAVSSVDAFVLSPGFTYHELVSPSCDWLLPGTPGTIPKAWLTDFLLVDPNE